MRSSSDTCDAVMKYTASRGCVDCHDMCIRNPCDFDVPEYIPEVQIVSYVKLKMAELETENV